MIVVIGPNDLLKIQNGIAEVVQLFQSLSLVEICSAQGRWRLVDTFCVLSELIEIFKGLL